MLRNEKLQKALIYFCAIVPGFFAIAWIHTFGFTNYRHHLAFIGLPLGVSMGILAIGMVFLKRWAIVISIGLTILAILASFGIFFLSRHLFYVAVAVVGCIYTYSSIHYLRQEVRKT
jgi:hypothetical protein